MPVNTVSGALAAYREALANVGKAGMPPRSGESEDGFGALVRSALAETARTGAKGEVAAAKAAAGAGDVSEVVAAVTNAELTLQTVIAVRDRVIQAYQEIVRMPI